MLYNNISVVNGTNIYSLPAFRTQRIFYNETVHRKSVERFQKMSKCNLDDILGQHFIDYMPFPEFCFSQFPEYSVVYLVDLKYSVNSACAVNIIFISHLSKNIPTIIA